MTASAAQDLVTAKRTTLTIATSPARLRNGPLRTCFASSAASDMFSRTERIIISPSVRRSAGR